MKVPCRNQCCVCGAKLQFQAPLDKPQLCGKAECKKKYDFELHMFLNNIKEKHKK